MASRVGVKMGLFDSQAKKLIDGLLNQAKKQQNKQRKDNCLKIWAINKGDQKQFLDNDLSTQFEELYSRLYKYETVGPNIIRFVNKQNSMVYKVEPQRVVDDEATNQLYNDWIANNHINIKLDTANQMTFLQKTMHLWVKWDDQKQDVALSLINQGLTDVVQNRMDVTKADALIFQISSTDTVEDNDPILYYYMDAETQIIFDENGNKYNAQMEVDDVNPYGKMMFVKCDYDYNPDEYFSQPDDRLLMFQSSVDKNATWDEVMRYYQSMSQPYITNFDGDPKKLIASPFHPLILNSDAEGVTGSVNFATPDPKIIDCWTVGKEKIIQLANEYNVDPQALRMDGSPPSGESLKAMARRQIEERRRQLKYWRIYEKELFELWKTAMITNGKSVNENAEISILFGEVGFEETIKEIIERYNFEKENALTSPQERFADYHAERSKSIAEIEEKIVENDAENKKINNRFTRVNIREV